MTLVTAFSRGPGALGLVALGVAALLWSSAPGCRRERSAPGQPGSAPKGPAARAPQDGAGPPKPLFKDPGPGATLARQGPRGATPEDGPATPTPELEGFWSVERVLVEGKAVPLPKTYTLRLELRPDGTLVVQGLQRTKPSRDEGVWRVRGGKLHTRIGRLAEVRTFVRQGESLTLTRGGAFPVTWELKKDEAPRTAEGSSVK